jgi:hypothetical protein
MSDGLKWCWCVRGSFCSTCDMCEQRHIDLERIKLRAAAKAKALEEQDASTEIEGAE